MKKLACSLHHALVIIAPMLAACAGPEADVPSGRPGADSADTAPEAPATSPTGSSATSDEARERAKAGDPEIAPKAVTCADDWSRPIALEPGESLLDDGEELQREKGDGVEWVLSRDHTRMSSGSIALPRARVLLEKVCTDTTKCTCPGKVLVVMAGITTKATMVRGGSEAAVFVRAQPLNNTATESLHRVSLTTGAGLAKVPIGRPSTPPYCTSPYGAVTMGDATLHVTNGDRGLELLASGCAPGYTGTGPNLRVVYATFFSGDAASTAEADVVVRF